MKKITILGLVLLGLGFSPLLVSADIPMGPGWHYVEYCSKITNLNEFPDIIPIGVYRGATADGTGFVINNNECIKGGYKFSTLAIGWIVKNKFKSINLNKLNIDASYLPTDINILSTDFPFYIGELKDNTHIKAVTTEHLITQKDGIISLNKSKETTEYNNGTTNKIETFDSTSQNQNMVKPVKMGFWKLILCFFGIGKSC